MTWIMVALVLVVTLVVAYSFFTREGSGIQEHPVDDGAAPGAAEPGDATGEGRTPESPTGENASGGRFSTHGMQ